MQLDWVHTSGSETPHIKTTYGNLLQDYVQLKWKLFFRVLSNLIQDVQFLHLTLHTSQEEAPADGLMQFTWRNSAEDISGSDMMFHLHDQSAKYAFWSAVFTVIPSAEKRR